MKRLLCTLSIIALFSLTADFASAQAGGGGGAGGGQGEGGFTGGDGQFGADRISGSEGFDDIRAQTGTGENNRTLGGGQNQANNMNFLNALFGGNVGNQNVNQNQALRGRGIRAPFRLGFKFDGMAIDSGIKNLNSRIVRLPKFKNSKITGVLQEKTLLLVGEVATQEEASLAVRIARFEPGVDQVKSLLTVAKPQK